MALVCGVSCRCGCPEERMGPSVVSLVDSLVSEWPEAVPSWVECMVFRVDLRDSHLVAPRESWEGRWRWC